ncbi:MAG: hypothetical protein WBM50_21025, partial [Acidimicrobiales bacterium]
AIAGRSWRMRAEIDRTSDTDDGVLVAWGTANTGLSCYLLDGRVAFDYNLFGTHHVVAVPAPAPGPATVEVVFDRTDSGADVSISVAGGESNTMKVPWVLRFIGMSGMDVGRDAGSPISDAYPAPFPFSGRFSLLEFEVTEELDPREIMKLDRERVRREFSSQ